MSKELAELFQPQKRNGLRLFFGTVTSVSPLMVLLDSAEVAIGPLMKIRGSPAAAERVALIHTPQGLIVIGKEAAPGVPPSSMIQVQSNLSSFIASDVEINLGRTFSLTNVLPGDVLLVGDFWELHNFFPVSDELWADDLSFQYAPIVRVRNNRLGLNLFWHTYQTGDANSTRSVWSGGGIPAQYLDGSLWPNPFNENVKLRRYVARIRGANQSDPFTSALTLLDSDGNNNIALPGPFDAEAHHKVIALAIFVNTSAFALLGNPSANAPQPGFSVITQNLSGASVGLGLTLSHTTNSPLLVGPISGRTMTAASGLLTEAISAILAAKGA